MRLAQTIPGAEREANAARTISRKTHTRPAWSVHKDLAIRSLRRRRTRQHACALPVDRQADAEREPLAFMAHQLDFAAVFAHDTPDDEQPEPGAARLGREVRLEDFAHGIGGDA